MRADCGQLMLLSESAPPRPAFSRLAIRIRVAAAEPAIATAFGDRAL